MKSQQEQRTTKTNENHALREREVINHHLAVVVDGIADSLVG